jgi:predicted ATPase/class 3 adenylate cyclase
MAIRTSNDAFSNLRLDPIGRETVSDHLRDFAYLRSANVIELQHHDVRFAAIDTSMARQIIECYNCGIAMTTPLRLPTGTVTFLFTDIEGSTALWGRAPAAMNDALAIHDALFQSVVSAHGGVIFKTVGDAVCAAFERADSAIAAAIEAQRRLPVEQWPEATGQLRVRMGIHTGQAIERDSDYFGPALNRVARVMGIAHGGQVLVTNATASIVDGVLAADIRLHRLGIHHLKGLANPEAVHQLVAPGLHAEFPPLTSAEDHPNNLPAQISSFVGRTQELATLPELLERHRLLTIVGPGGIGKTRLALQLAASLLGNFAGGCWFVELATLRDGDLIVPTIARILGISEDSSETLEAALMRHLQRIPTLLVLDNSEHLLADVARITRHVLAGCESLRIVATSREPLFVIGEHVFRLEALSLNGTGPSEAAQLFVERAHGEIPTVGEAAEMRLVDQICRGLEGIPLAIELAAARTGALSLRAIAERLADRLALLVSRDVSQNDRHRTLRAAIDWSYELLTPDERRFARAVSTFDGGFTLEGARYVSAVTDVADLVESLHYKSLITAASANDRYFISDMIGEYLREALAAEDEAETVRGRHFDLFFTHVVPGLNDGAPGSSTASVRSIEADEANLRAALIWGIAHRLADATKLTLRLAPYWQKAGRLVEGETWFRRLLATSEIGDADRAPLLRRASTFATMRARHDEARDLIIASREAYERLGDRSGIAETTYNIAVLEHRLGNGLVAEERYLEALEGFESTNHVIGKLRASMNLVLLAHERHDLEAAQAILDRADSVAAAIADADIHSDLASLRAALLRERGQYAAAIELYRASIDQKRNLGNRYAVADLLLCVAEISIAQDEVYGAMDALREVFDIEAQIGATAHLITALEASAEALMRLSIFGRAAVAHSYAARLRASYGFHTAYAWDNDSRERSLRGRVGDNAQLVRLLDDASPLDWTAALAAARLLDGLVDTRSY